MTNQLGFDLVGGTSLLDRIKGEPPRPALAHDDAMPPGPYTVGKTKVWAADGESCYEGFPYVIRAGDGRCIAGHIDCLATAEAVCRALNLAPAGALSHG